jgi:hypothetical protein
MDIIDVLRFEAKRPPVEYISKFSFLRSANRSMRSSNKQPDAVLEIHRIAKGNMRFLT